MAKTICYVGNWWEADKGFWASGGKSTIGVCACEYDEKTGALAPFEEKNKEICVGSQCIDEKRKTLYVVDEKLTDPAFRVGGGGAVSSFKIDPETGALTFLNRVPSYGVLTAFIAIDPAGEFLVVANHTSHNFITRIVRNDAGDFEVKVEHDDATIVLYEINEDGSIGRACDVYYCHGSGPLGQQTLSHLHSAYFAPLGDFFLVCDKGGDLIHTLRIDRENRKLIACCEPCHTEAGTMPRYADFHPSKPFVYTNNEAEPFLYAFRYSPDGRLEMIEKVPGIAPEVPYSGVPYTIKQSDIRISADGKILYSLVRDVGMISVYSIDQETGHLTMIQCKPVDDKDPHSCALAPDGRFLLVGGLHTHRVLSYPINADGTLGDLAAECSQPSACHIIFEQL